MHTVRKEFVFCLQIIDVHDVSSIYRVPIILDDQQLDLLLAKRLELLLPAVRPPRFLLKWKDLADRFVLCCLLILFGFMFNVTCSNVTVFIICCAC